MDFALSNVNGITYKYNNFPIFINLFRFRNLNNKYSTGDLEAYLKVYLFVVLCHEMAHYLVRKLRLIRGSDDSNKNKIADEDGGDLFEKFLFTRKVQFLQASDLKFILDLLSAKEQ